uniref:Uncharacterized protein n=1 Tax=viral metagenome TaxID=1070528 RepID=A0A6C0IEW3_9ZZZZ
MSEEFVNQVTLNYLMNKDQYNKYVTNNTIKLPNAVNKKDKKFYRKRIYNIVKQLLSSQETEIEPRLFTDVQKSFDNFVNICIHSLKVIDQSDIIQDEYKDIGESITLNLDLNTELDAHDINTKEEADLLLVRSIKIANPSLDNFVKKKYTKAPDKIAMPQQKDINLRDPTLKIKGIKEKDNLNSEKKKNITNIYDKAENTEKKDSKDDKK